MKVQTFYPPGDRNMEQFGLSSIKCSSVRRFKAFMTAAVFSTGHSSALGEIETGKEARK